jgi:phospholipid-binding lipoprotein MlaA
MDPYIFTRESFLQYRKHLVTDGPSEITDDILDFDDEFYADEEFADENDNKDVNSEVDQGIAKTKIANEVENGHDLKSSIDNQKPKAASFENVSESFDNTTRSFEEASDKIDLQEGQ